MTSAPAEPTFGAHMGPSAAGRIGSAKRWGPPRRINLRDMDEAGRRIVLASVAAVRAEHARDTAAAQK